MKRCLFALFLLSLGQTAVAQTAPALRATYDPNNGTVLLAWTPVAGASYYRLRKTNAYPTWSYTFSDWGGTSRNDSLPPNSAWIYRVWAVDSNGAELAASNAALVSTYAWSEPLVAGTTPVSDSHIAELRNVLAAVRLAAGVGVPTWTRSSLDGEPIWNEDIEELRTALNGAVAAIGLPAPPYEPLTSGTPIKRAHLQQLRSLVRAYPEYVWVTSSGLSESHFSPNADGTKDTTTYSATIVFSTDSPRTAVDFNWSINVRSSTSMVVRSASGVGTNVIFAWDGRDGAGAVQPDGNYSFELIDLESLAAPIHVMSAVLDNTAPAASLSSPAEAFVVSNVRTSGGGDVTVTGTATDSNLVNWRLDRNGNGQSTVQIGTGTSNVSSSTLGLWKTLTDFVPIPNGTYQLVLTVDDRAGNRSTVTRNVTVGHFSVTQTAHQLSVPAGGTVTFASTVPFNATETIEIVTSSGQVVRSLVPPTLRAAGVYSDVWNGRDGNGALLPDDKYYAVATITEGSSSYTWDPRSSFVNGTSTQFEYPKCALDSEWVACNDSRLQFDPFANKPLRFAYCVGPGNPGSCSGSLPALVVAKAAPVGETDAACTQGCLFNAFQPGGQQEYSWYGTDDGWNYIAATYGGLTVIRRFDVIPKNMTLLYGTTPVISNPRYAAFFNPGGGTNANGKLTFVVNVDTYDGRQAKLELSFTNIDPYTAPLRTLTTDFGAEGDLTAEWDGRADNGAWVAPGTYLVTITAIDSAGSRASIRPLVIVRY